MARLFITQREQNLISDWTKEITKDVIGQYIMYYAISDAKSADGGIYGESCRKVPENPIKIDVRAGVPTNDMVQTDFGPEVTEKLEILVHARDLVDKRISISLGDFFSYGDGFYEILKVNQLKPIYGQVEHVDGYRITSSRTRRDQFLRAVTGPTTYGGYPEDTDAIQRNFSQQRGESEIDGDETGDKRELVSNGTYDPPIDGPRKIADTGSISNPAHSFYGED